MIEIGKRGIILGVRKFVSSTVVSSNFFSQLQSVRQFDRFFLKQLLHKSIDSKNSNVGKVLDQ